MTATAKPRTSRPSPASTPKKTRREKLSLASVMVGLNRLFFLNDSPIASPVESRRRKSQRPVVNMVVAGGDETFEQGVRLVRFALKFRVKLAGDEKRMVLQFDPLHQFSVRR